MRTLWRNLQTFWYCPYKGRDIVLNEQGLRTGDANAVYGEAVEAQGNVSYANVGRVELEFYGVDPNYTRVLVVEDGNFPMTESDVVFLDKQPEYDSAGNPLYDYTVIRVGRTKHSGATYALRKVR